MKNPITKLLTVTALLGASHLALAGVRTLPSGAPACGNTMGKGGFDERACTADEQKQIDAQRAQQRPARVATKAPAAKASPPRVVARPAKPSPRR